jgi:site-specific DNA recombinase
MVHTVIGYVRVSSEDQAASGLSLEAQRERIRAYCHARGWTLADIVTDAGASARTLDRPGMDTVRRLMADRLVDSIVALKLDRLTRSVRDLHQLMQLSADTGVGIVSVTENLDTTSAAGRLMVNVLAAMAEWEREVIAERTTAALAVKRRRGERISRFDSIGQAAGARGELERMALDHVRRLLEDSGGVSLRDMAARLDAAGFRNRAGRPYHASAVSRMISRLTREHPHLNRRAVIGSDVDTRVRRISAVIAGVAA